MTNFGSFVKASDIDKHVRLICIEESSTNKRIRNGKADVLGLKRLYIMS